MNRINYWDVFKIIFMVIFIAPFALIGAQIVILVFIATFATLLSFVIG